MGQTAGYVAIMIAVGSIFFEVSKIKINPISFLLKWIGKRMFEPMNSRLEAVEKKIDENKRSCRGGYQPPGGEGCNVRADGIRPYIHPRTFVWCGGLARF